MNPVELAAALIEFDSRNPSLVPGAPGEGRVASFLGEILDRWGFKVQLTEVENGRSNLVATAGRTDGPSLMLNGHLDVVGIEGMAHPPFIPNITDGRLYGRGSADMKGGLAAMCVAAHQAVKEGIDGQIIIAAVIDEEYDSIGTKSLIESGIRADAAIITEPTKLAICPAHRGFVWVEATVKGHAAHGSRYDIGIDAITQASVLIADLDKINRDTIATQKHHLLGKSSLHASTIQGGTGLSTYPSACTVRFERRTIPGETPETFLAELNRAYDEARVVYPDLQVDFRVIGAQHPSDVSIDTPIVQTVQEVLSEVGVQPRIKGMSAWTDAALLNEAGIPAICFGPGDILMAHAATEYIPVQEIEQATTVLKQVILRWCNPA